VDILLREANLTHSGHISARGQSDPQVTLVFEITDGILDTFVTKGT